MSHASVSSQRSLTLPEELEKLEQSITLTLQEIDHNFSRAHRIVTASILPVVERYAEHSKDVWEGSKFWKQFFEASANVSLSSYKEPSESETVTEDLTETMPPSEDGSSSLHHDDSMTSDHQQAYSLTNGQSVLDSSISQSTPRGPIAGRPAASVATYSSPYEALRREMRGITDDDHSTSTMPSTPRTHHQFPNPQSSPFHPPSTSRHNSHRTPANDLLLHRVLDKNWRLQATPHSQAQRLPHRGVSKVAETPLFSTRKQGKQAYQQDPQNLDSSPAMPMPQLHTDIFNSPVRRPRVPGVSVFTPARAPKPQSQTLLDKNEGYETRRSMMGVWDSDSDEEAELEGMSPPKTMQFHIPRSRLLRTPAREASKRIVEDLLLTAGGGNVTDDLDEDSPSVIKRRGLLDEEDTF